MAMIDYFAKNENLRLEIISEQSSVNGNMELAKALDRSGGLVAINAGDTFIEQGAETKDVFFIMSGSCDIVINGQTVAQRGSKMMVGEMAIIQPTQKRSATCRASESMVLLRLTGEAFQAVAAEFPTIYQPIAKELAKRLLERNSSLRKFREKIRVFMICSVEALDIARQVQNAFEHDPFTTVIWTDGVFRVATYPIETLEKQIDDSDFAIAIAHADDLLQHRDAEWPVTRDNVIFELGLFMGRLGRARAILMEPRTAEVKLPSDLSGITTIVYSYEKGKDVAATLAPACNKLREHIRSLGAYNG